MSPVWIAFSVGCILGAVVVIFVLSACYIAGEADRKSDGFRSDD